MRSLFWFLATAVLAGAVLTYFRFGTVQPCGVLRQVAREADMRGGGLEALVASQLPDSVYDRALALQHGPLTPGKCVGVLVASAARSVSFTAGYSAGYVAGQPSGSRRDIEPVVIGREPHGLNEAE